MKWIRQYTTLAQEYYPYYAYEILPKYNVCPIPATELGRNILTRIWHRILDIEVLREVTKNRP